MDGTDLLCYNTDMNDVIFAGYRNALQINSKMLTVIFLPDDHEVLVVPPPHKAELPVGEFLCVEIDKPAVPLDGVKKINSLNIARALFVAYENFDKSGARLCGTDSILSALGDLIAAYINRACVEEKKSPAVAHALKEIESQAFNPIFSVEECLSKLPLNYDYMRKLFKKEVGATPHEYLLGLRMRRAQTLISSGVSSGYGVLTVAQIAESCGFAEPLYFSRVFKKYFGVSPSLYGK